MEPRIGRLAAPLFVFFVLCAAAPVPPAIVAAVTNPDRPDADRSRDLLRKPAESVAFAGLAPGQTVVDFIPGGGYFTRIFSNVVGPTGHVYAVVPSEMVFGRRPGPPPAYSVVVPRNSEPPRSCSSMITEKSQISTSTSTGSPG